MNISNENSFSITLGALPSSIKNGFDDETSSETSSDDRSDTRSEGSNRSFHIGSAPTLSSKSSKRRRRVIESTPSLQFSTASKCSFVTRHFWFKFKPPIPSFSMSDQTTLGPTVFIPKGKRACIKGYVEKKLEKREIDEISDYVSLEEILEIESSFNEDVSEFDTESVSDEDSSVSDSDEIRPANQLLNRVGISDESLPPLSGAFRNKGLMECVFESNVFTPTQLEQRKKFYETEMEKALQKSRKIKCEKNSGKSAKQQPYRIISFFQSIGRSFYRIFEKISSVYTNNRFQPPSPDEQKTEMLYPYHPTRAEVVAKMLGCSTFSRENPYVPQSWFEKDMTQIRYATLEEIEKRQGPFEKV